MYPIIDTHIHIWDFSKARYSWLEEDTSILNRNYLIEELEEERVEAAITGGVLVQAANNLEDTDFMLATAEQTPWLKGVVGWLPLEQPELVQQLLNDKYLHHPYFKGVRHLMHDEADTQWTVQPNVVESLRILADNHLTYDIVATQPAHMEGALLLAEKIPHLQMALDHISQPPIATKEQFGRWGELMAEAAKHPQFFAKISGLGTASKNFTDWKADDIAPYIEHTIQLFGEDRCFMGGDWPVSLLAGSYVHTWQAYKQVLLSLLEETGQRKLLSLNAIRFYQLESTPN